MLKKLARKILKTEIKNTEFILRNTDKILEHTKTRLLQAQDALDTYKEQFTFGLGSTSRDLPFTHEEKEWLKQQGESKTLPNILDKLLMNVIAGLAKQPQPATSEDAQRLQNIRLAFLLLQSEALKASGKEVNVDPLTTEVR